MIGPTTKPDSSTWAKPAEALSGRGRGPMPATMARAAGMKHPAEAPMRARAPSSSNSVWPKAKAVLPSTARARPPSSSRLA